MISYSVLKGTLCLYIGGCLDLFSSQHLAVIREEKKYLKEINIDFENVFRNHSFSPFFFFN